MEIQHYLEVVEYSTGMVYLLQYTFLGVVRVSTQIPNLNVQPKIVLESAFNVQPAHITQNWESNPRQAALNANLEHFHP